MADPLPWFPFYALDWINSPRVLALEPAARDAYQMLLCLQWRDDGLPGDVNGLWPLLPANVKRTAAARMLGEFFPVDPADGKRRNLKLSRLRDEAVKKLNTNRSRSKVAADARWNASRNAPSNAPGNAPSIPEASSEQCSGMPESESESERETTTTSSGGGLPVIVEEALAPYLITARYPDSIRSTISLLLDPRHSPHFDADLVASCLREMQAANRSFNSGALARWCANRLNPPPTTGNGREARMVGALQRFVEDDHATP